MTLPWGQTPVDTRQPADVAEWLTRLQHGTLPFRKVVIAGPLWTAVLAVTAAYTVRETDATILADATGGAFSVTLPTAVGIRGREALVKRLNGGGNAVTVAAAGGETIDGAATVVLGAQYDRVRVQSDGANWMRVD